LPLLRPNACWGWDSHEKHWYFGRTLYMLVCRNPKLALDFPFLLNFTSAKRHDSINFLFIIDAFSREEIGVPIEISALIPHMTIFSYKMNSKAK